MAVWPGESGWDKAYRGVWVTRKKDKRSDFLLAGIDVSKAGAPGDTGGTRLTGGKKRKNEKKGKHPRVGAKKKRRVLYQGRW